MVMREVPTAAAVGVPLRRPVVALKFSQLGLPVIENCSVLPSGSDAVGVNVYAWPTVTLVRGVPEMVGARLAGAVVATVIENAGSDTVSVPSLTEITMPEVVPTLFEAGVPVSMPVAGVNVAQLGLLVMENVS